MSERTCPNCHAMVPSNVVQPKDFAEIGKGRQGPDGTRSYLNPVYCEKCGCICGGVDGTREVTLTERVVRGPMPKA